LGFDDFEKHLRCSVMLSLDQLILFNTTHDTIVLFDVPDYTYHILLEYQIPFSVFKTYSSLICCTRRVSGITVIRYANNQKIGEPNNLKVCGNKLTKGTVNRIAKNSAIVIIYKVLKPFFLTIKACLLLLF
jgi:hypothetical protein